MDFKQFEYVITIADEKTLLAASRKLYISPSALSQFITKLEAEINVPLFKRTKTGWVPTHAGQLYIDMCRDILTRKKLTYQEISDIIEAKTGHFTVGVTPGRGTWMFSEVFPKFKEAYPTCQISIVEGKIKDLLEKVRLGIVDIAFVTSGIECSDLDAEILCHERLLLVTSQHHALSQLIETIPDQGNCLPSIQFSKLEHEDFILMNKGSTLRTMADNVFSEAKISPNIIFETSSAMTINRLARNGYGIAIIPSCYIHEKTDIAALYFNTIPPIHWDLLAVYLKGSYLTRAEKYFISLVKEYYERTTSS